MVGILAVFLVLIVGYAIFNESLTVGGTANVSGEFSIIFKNVGGIVETGSSGTTAQISTNKKNLTITVPHLEYPGAYAEIPVVIKNTGTINARLKGIITSGLEDDDIKVTYSGVVQDEVLVAQEERNMKIKVAWDSASVKKSANIAFTISLNYEQDNGMVVTVPPGGEMTKEMFTWNGEGVISGLSDAGITKVRNNGGYLLIPEGVTEIEGANYDFERKIGSIDKGFSPFAIGKLNPSTATEEQKRDPAVNVINYVVFPSTLKKIGNYAFTDCTNLTGVLNLPEGIEEIGVGAFANSNVSGNLIIPRSVTKIGDYAFSGTIITSLQIGSGLKNISHSAFSNCKNLGGELIIPDSVVTIEDYAFDSTAITSVRIGSRVNSIGKFSFANCKGLVGELFIPDNVTSLGAHAFYVYPRSENKLTNISVGPDTIFVPETFLFRPEPTVR